MKSFLIVYFLVQLKQISGVHISNEEVDKILNEILASKVTEDVQRINKEIVKSYHDFRRVVEGSPLLNVIKKLPKGANLQGYLYGLTSYEYVYNLTWNPSLMVCTNSRVFRFSYGDLPGFGCRFVKQLRRFNYDFDKTVKSKLLLSDSEARHPTEAIILTKYKIVESLVSKKNILQHFLLKMLSEQYSDGVTYVEFRSSLTFHDTENNINYRPLEVMGMYKEVIDFFMKYHPKFIGAKVVYSPYGTELYNNPKACIEIVREVAEVYPNLIAGIEFFTTVNIRLLLTLPKTIEVYYNRAKRIRSEEFEDLVLPPSRLVTVSERQMLSDLLIKKSKFDIKNNRTTVIEVCPNSIYFQRSKNTMKSLIPKYISDGYKMIICSEFPSFWHTRPLSHDWYLVFLFVVGIPDAKLIRKIARTSFVHGNLDTEMKLLAIVRWESELKRTIYPYADV